MSNHERNSKILWRRSGEDALLFSLDTGSLWRLNLTGALIWELLDGEHAEEDLAEKIRVEFPETSEQRIMRGLESFLNSLKERNLLS